MGGTGKGREERGKERGSKGNGKGRKGEEGKERGKGEKEKAGERGNEKEKRREMMGTGLKRFILWGEKQPKNCDFDEILNFRGS